MCKLNMKVGKIEKLFKEVETEIWAMKILIILQRWRQII